MILYPTETIYALGVNALDETAVAELFKVKGRADGKAVSWLVRTIDDVERYGVLSPRARRIAECFLPGPLTLVVPARAEVSRSVTASDGTISFRISPDPIAQEVIADFMAQHDAPLTCTSANKSGEPTESTPEAILRQLGEMATLVDTVVDDGPRSGIASTVVKVVGDTVEIIRVGAIPAEYINAT